jgi:hypothetical protein
MAHHRNLEEFKLEDTLPLSDPELLSSDIDKSASQKETNIIIRIPARGAPEAVPDGCASNVPASKASSSTLFSFDVTPRRSKAIRKQKK